MSATITPDPSGRFRVTCDRCHTTATTPFREVAYRWSRDHRCPAKDTTGGAA